MAQPTPEQLKQVLTETLSPNAEVRRAAERNLSEAQKVSGHPLQVLQLVANANAADAAVQQAAAVHFKNIVKNGWDEHREEGTNGIVISPGDRNTIKTHLVQLMITTAPQIQAQVSEAISLIAEVDYPEHWDNLVPELVQHFNSTDPSVVVGVLKTANSIFKRFRYVGRSDELYRIIAYTLERIQAPLLALFVETGKAVEAFANDSAQLKPRLESLRLMCRIFYSLNYQDLPEFFEDHIKEWMEQFAKYLQYSNPCVTDDSEESEPGPIDKLQAAIVQNLALYADKDEEPFLPFLPNFTKLVWHLLLTVSSQPKHDTLATTSIKFLSSLVSKLMHKALFQEEATLREIVQKIVIPNLMFRESDEELFEDDPAEYIMTEIQGSDSESRRRCSQDLLRSMCRQFEAQTTTICSEHVGEMLAEYAKDPNNDGWRAKDAAIHLMLGISIRRESALGVSEINDAVNVMDFFNTQVFPELQDTSHNLRPVVKATSLKFVTTFRNQFTGEQLVALMPLLISHLGSPTVAVHTLAAYSIERLVATKEDIPGGAKRSKISNAQLQPFLQPLFAALFSIVDNTNLNENDYVMKCVMRVLAAAGDDVIPVTQIVIEKLTVALGHVAKNPRNPQFNHYLFESIAVLVKSVCSKDPSAVATFESLLFPPFQSILQMEILEFSPYVFQILAQCLEFREGGLGDAYNGLFRPLLTPALWEKKGNVPALTRLIQAYLMKAGPELVSAGHLLPILGVFQKLLCTPVTEADGFNLLQSLIIYAPPQEVQPHLKTIFQLSFTRLQSLKAGRSEHRYARFSGLVGQFCALLVAKYGPPALFDVLNGIQPGLVINVLATVWLPRLHSDPPQGLNAKVQVIALTKVLCETPALFNDAQGQATWSSTLGAAVTLLTSPNSSFTTPADGDEMLEVQYDSQFSGLSFAKKVVIDPFPEVSDPAGAFVQALHGISTQQPGRLVPLIQEGLKHDPKLSTALEDLFKKSALPFP